MDRISYTCIYCLKVSLDREEGPSYLLNDFPSSDIVKNNCNIVIVVILFTCSSKGNLEIFFPFGDVMRQKRTLLGSYPRITSGKSMGTTDLKKKIFRTLFSL